MSGSYYRPAWLFPRSRLREPFPQRPGRAPVELFAPPAAPPDTTAELLAALSRKRRTDAATRRRRGKAGPFPAWLYPPVPSSVDAELLAALQRRRRGDAATRRPRRKGDPFAVDLFVIPPDTTPGMIASLPRRRRGDAATRRRTRTKPYEEWVLGNPPTPLPPTDAGLMVVLTRVKPVRIVPWRKVIRRRFASEALWPGPVFATRGAWRTWTTLDADSKPKPVAVVHMRAAAHRVYARLWDLTGGVEVVGSRLIADSSEFLWYATPFLTLVPGRRYRFEFGAEPGSLGEALAAEIVAGGLTP